MRTGTAAFLPLTMSVLAGTPVDRPGARALQTAARRAEQLACDSWQTLLGGCEHPHRTEFNTGLRRLSLAVGGFVGDDWSNGLCNGHRDRIARYHWWLEEALADGDGAEFAEAFARYDDALARSVASRSAIPSSRTGTSAVGTGPGTGATTSGTGATTSSTGATASGSTGPRSVERRSGAAAVRRSGTMAGWARQARAATTRATHRAVSPLRWATNRHATSSSRWSRH